MTDLKLFLQPIAMDLAWQKVDENLRKMEMHLKEALSTHQEVPSHERLVFFPETTLTAFATGDAAQLALSDGAEPIKRIASWAKRFKTNIGFGWLEKNGEAKPFNAYTVFNHEGSRIAHYRKIHLFSQGRPSENAQIEKGSEICVFELQGFRIALAVCFDLRFPMLFEKFFEEKADVILVPSCWVGGPLKSEQFHFLCAARAISAQAYCVGLNRKGKDPFFEYAGEIAAYTGSGERLRSPLLEIKRSVLDKIRMMDVTSARKNLT